MSVASWCPQLPLRRQHVMWQLANQGRLVKLLHQFIWLQFHLWIYQARERNKMPICAGKPVEQKGTADVHNLSERVSLKFDTVCGNTQNTPVLFCVLEPDQCFHVDLNGLCLHVLPSIQNTIPPVLWQFCVSLFMWTSRDWNLMWGIGFFSLWHHSHKATELIRRWSPCRSLYHHQTRYIWLWNSSFAGQTN